MSQDAPFELIVSALSPPGLKVELLNRSATDQVFCHSQFWQSCDLNISDDTGKPIPYNDQRVIMRPLMPIDQGAFGTIGSARREELISENFEKLSDEKYNLRLGYVNFWNLPAGIYEIVAELECRYNSWADDERKWHTEKDVWLGTIGSNPIKINLP